MKPVYNYTDPMDQLVDTENLSKYKVAGSIAAKVLDELVKMSIPGAKVIDICNQGDTLIKNECSKVYHNCTMKGIAFPTCVSLNNIAGNYCSTKDNFVIKNGDLVKIELGVHIDGFPALVCYTVLVGTVSQNDKRMQLLKAVSEAGKEILKIMKPGVNNTEIVKILKTTAEKYNVKVPKAISEMNAPGIVSHQIGQYVIDDHDEDDAEFVYHFILTGDSDQIDFTMRQLPLEENEVYAIDIVMCSGSGKLSNRDHEITVYKRHQERKYDLKLKTSKSALQQFGRELFPITTRDIADTRFRLGLKECLEKRLIEPYSVVSEKEGEYVARAKFTVIVREKPVLIVARSLEDQLKKIEKRII